MATNPWKSFACLFCFLTCIFLNDRVVLLFVDFSIPGTSYCGRWGFLFLMSPSHPHLHAINISQRCRQPWLFSAHVIMTISAFFTATQHVLLSLPLLLCVIYLGVYLQVDFWIEGRSCDWPGQQAPEHLIADVKFSRALFVLGIAN